jgi:hypothetical protein
MCMNEALLLTCVAKLTGITEHVVALHCWMKF